MLAVTDKKNDIVEDVNDAGEAVEAVEEVLEADAIDIAEETEGQDAPHEAGEPSPVVEAAPVIVKRAGFFPMVFGGIIAAGLGYGVAQYVPLSTFGISLPASERETAIDTQFKTLTDQVAALQGTIESTPDAPDFSADIKATQDAVSSVKSELSDGLAAVNAKIIEIEKRPIASGDAAVAVAAYEAELEAMQARITSVADEATAKIASAEAKASELEQNASLVSNAALARAALMRVETAVARGGVFDEALADFAEMSGSDIPAALQQASISGIATLPELQSAFPDAARAALAASRKENASGDALGRVGAFLKTQVNARSLTPRDGADPDAVLSRVEAALRDDRLEVALTEIAGLPETGQEALAAWTSSAQARLDAVSALQALALGEKG